MSRHPACVGLNEEAGLGLEIQAVLHAFLYRLVANDCHQNICEQSKILETVNLTHFKNTIICLLIYVCMYPLHIYPLIHPPFHLATCLINHLPIYPSAQLLNSYLALTHSENHSPYQVLEETGEMYRGIGNGIEVCSNRG